MLRIGMFFCCIGVIAGVFLADLTPSRLLFLFAVAMAGLMTALMVAILISATFSRWAEGQPKALQPMLWWRGSVSGALAQRSPMMSSLISLPTSLLNSSLWRCLIVALICGVAAFHYGQWRTLVALERRVPTTVEQVPVRVVGQVTSLVEQHAVTRHAGGKAVSSYHFDLRVLPRVDVVSVGSVSSVTRLDVPETSELRASAMGDSELAGKMLRVRGYSDGPVEIRAGDQLEAWLMISPIHGLVNGVGPDRERVALAGGVDGYASVAEVVAVTPVACCALTRWRERLVTQIAAHLDGGSVAAALIPALVAGDRRGLSAEHWRVLQRTGVAHLISISGLHISLVCGGLWWLAKKLLGLPLALTRSRLSASQWAVFPALFGAICYAALAGFSLPTSRALLMTLLVMAAHLMRLRIDAVTVLLLVLTVLLVMNPLDVLSAGFWLSFMAVGFLLALLSGGLRELLRAQLLLSLGSGAVAGWLFSAWSLVSIPANLLLVPLFSFLIIPLALLGTVLSTLPSWFFHVSPHISPHASPHVAPHVAPHVEGFSMTGLSADGAQVLLGACAWLIDGAWSLLEVLAAAPVIEAPTSLLAVLALLLVMMRFLLAYWPGPRWLYLFLLLPWLCPPSTHSLANGQFEVIAFDVGQGQMTAIRTRHNVLLYDSGPLWRQGSAVSSILRPWLAAENVTPRLAFISHGDTDHSGGLTDMRSLWPDMPIFTGDIARIGDALPCLRGQHWHIDGVRVEVLWPRAQVPLRRSNNRSCVVKISSADGHSSALLSGDIELPVEFWLTQNEASLRSDLLQVPHHGSQTSSSYAFIRAVQPRWASVPSGYRNRFHHPAVTTQQRYQQFSVPLFNTSTTGRQRFIFADGKVERPEFARDSTSWPWRVPMPVIE